MNLQIEEVVMAWQIITSDRIPGVSVEIRTVCVSNASTKLDLWVGMKMLIRILCDMPGAPS